MANCTDKFLRFNRAISLSSLEKKFLRKARKTITEKIRKNFSSKSQIPPIEFKVQGSFTMDTIIKPLKGEFDIDIGIYFKFPSNNRDEWPIPQTVSGWVIDAVKNHTSYTPENKVTCVRVTYKPILGAKDYGYHVDLPIYGRYKDSWGDEYNVIGLNDERQWTEKSDSLGFAVWFDKQCAENKNDRHQLVRIVRYLKAWKDFQSKEIKMPSGMILTVLAAKNFFPNDRDDVCLYKMLNNVHFLLWWDFYIRKPVAPKNNLAEKLSSRQREFFMERLKEFRNDAYTAIHSDSEEEALRLWRKHFGERMWL